MGYFGEICILAADAVLLSLLNSWYRRISQSTREIKKAPKVTLDDEFRKGLESSKTHCVEYACVEGEIMPVRLTLHSRHMEGQTGVIQSISIEEHKSKRIQGFWTDVKNTIKDSVQAVPFMLRQWIDNRVSSVILVMEPLDAEFVTDDLTTTYDHFEPTNSGWMTRGMDRIFGEVTKGHHETEKMLLTNTMMLGIGKITLVDNKLQLKAPDDSGRRFVLTTMSKEEVIKRLENRSFWLRVFMMTVGTVGIVIMVRLVIKIYRKRRSEQAREAILLQAQQQRQQEMERREVVPAVTEDGAAGDGDNDLDNCVICLTNRREIVLLNCGHICLCAECLTMLPDPLLCPVCRQPVEHYVTTYRP